MRRETDTDDTITIPVDWSEAFATGEADGYDEYDGWKHIATEDFDQTRWGVVAQSVVQDPDGKFWALDWERGATEHQDYNDFSGREEMTWHRVYPHQVTVTKYSDDPPREG